VVQITVLVVRRRRDEQVAEERGDGQHAEAALRHVRRTGVLLFEATSLGQSARQVACHDHEQERQNVNEAPAAGADVGEGKSYDAQPCPETGGHGQHRDRVGAATPRHFLGGDHGNQYIEGESERATECLRSGEDSERRRQRTEGGHERCRGSGEHDHPPSPHAVGEKDDGQGEDDAGAHDRAGHSFRRVVHDELVGRKADRLGEQRVDVADDQRRRGQQTEHVGLAGTEAIRRRPPRLRLASGRMAQGPPHRQREQEREPRDGEGVVDRLRRRAVGVDDEVTFVRSERAVPKPEHAVARGQLAHEVLARRREQADGRIPALEALHDATHRRRA
jgi:hypothetical protein